MVGFLFKRFLRSRKGTTAIEFALIALPFFLLLFGIIETTMIYFANAVLENGLEVVARKIRTGQVQTQSLSEQDVKNLLCAEIDALLACDAHLAIDIRPSSGFSGVTFTNPLDGGGNLRTDFTFDPGKAGEVVLARAFYTWDVMTPLIAGFLANTAGGDRLLISSIAFRNEPF
jgi:Flp pilus assembly protein TadG